VISDSAAGPGVDV